MGFVLPVHELLTVTTCTMKVASTTYRGSSTIALATLPSRGLPRVRDRSRADLEGVVATLPVLAANSRVPVVGEDVHQEDSLLMAANRSRRSDPTSAEPKRRPSERAVDVRRLREGGIGKFDTEAVEWSSECELGRRILRIDRGWN